jgi:hypothetical protein
LHASSLQRTRKTWSRLAAFSSPVTAAGWDRLFPDGLIGANTMRFILALGLLMTLYASANAATRHHQRTRHHAVIPPGVASSYAAVPGWTYAPTVHYDDTPSYNDPSKSGGPAALPIQN